MYICLDCGRLFYEGDEKRYRESSSGEEWFGCPHCAGAYEEALECEVCGTYHSEENVHRYYKGDKRNTRKLVTKFVCENCFENLITYDNIIKFFEAKKELLIDFVLENVYGTGCICTDGNDEMHRDFLKKLKELIEVEKVCGIPKVIKWFRGFIDSPDDFLEFIIEGGEDNG